jgi:MFS family permease
MTLSVDDSVALSSPAAPRDAHECQVTNEPELAVDWRSQCVMLSGGALVTLALTGITIVLPQIEVELAHSPTDRLLIKLLASVIGLTMIVGAPLAGFLVDRLRLKPVLVTSCLLYAGAGVAGFFLHHLAGLFVCRLIVGLTAAGIATMSMILINTKLRPAGRAKWMGRHIAAAMLGGIVLTPLIGLLAERGWRWPFLLYALTVPLALVARGIPETPIEPRPLALVGPRPPLLRWFPARYALLAVVIGVVTFLPTVYVPFVIRAAGVSDPLKISLVLLMDSVIGAGMALSFAAARRRLSPEAAFAFSFACSATGMLVVASGHQFANVLVGMIVFGFGLGWFIPNLMTTALVAVPAEHQGRATGLLKGAFYLAAPASVIIAEPITRNFGPRGAMWLVFAVALGALGVFLGAGLKAAHRSPAAV